MSNIHDDFPVHNGLEGIWLGTVATDAANVNDPIQVIIPDFSETHRWGPCRWATRGTALPTRGKDCLVAFNNEGEPAVIAWWDGTSGISLDAVAGTGSLRTLGTGANQAAAGNDPRFNTPYPWLIDIDVFGAAIAQTNFDILTPYAASLAVYGASKDSSGAQNDEINFDVVLAAGTWTLELMHVRGTNRGAYTCSLDIDGTLGVIDGYNSPTVYNTRSTLTGLTISTTGKQRLKLKMATRNALNLSSYLGSIQHIQLRRTA